MILQIEDLSVEVSKKKLSANILFPEPKPYKVMTTEEAKMQTMADAVLKAFGEDKVAVVLRRERVYQRRSDGQELGTVNDVTYKDQWIDDKGDVVPFDLISWLLEKDGKLVPSRRYSGSKVITGLLDINRNIVENWLPESVYELYISRKKYNEAEYKRMQAKLFQKAEEWYAKDKAVLGQFVFRDGGKPYAMLLYPYIKKEEDSCKFCFVMACSRTKQEFENLMEISTMLTQPTVQLAEEPNNEALLKAIAA